ncbi:MAG TPA: hypothetical protein VK172_10455 [Lentimicrobium sp.]|nr:hypothetical protein [Lentimicrobium sp.]
MGKLKTAPKDETTLKWEKKVADVLVGKTIRNVRYMTDKEMQDFMWYKKAIIIFFTDGTYILPSSDDEGNNAGALHTNIASLPIIPVI